MSLKKQSLGKGLDALFEENDVEIDEKQVKLIKTDLLEPNKEQPRRIFDKTALSELADSLSEHGMLQPIIARKLGDVYQIISGERRWRAARMAGLLEVPVIVKELDDREALEIAMIENLQREDLNLMEEAVGYRRLMDEFGMTQEALSKRVGKSRPVIANSLRLLSLPENVAKAAETGEITGGHARAFLPLCEKLPKKEIDELLKKTVNGLLTVRDLENLSKRVSAGSGTKKSSEKDIYLKQLETDIGESLGRKIKISSRKNSKGNIQIEFYNKNDFEALITALKTIDRR